MKTNFDLFIEEITSLEIRISKPDNIYILDHYTQFEPEYESRLKLIMNHALTDILKLSDEQISKQVKRLEIEEIKFQEIHEYFEKQYSLFCSGTSFDSEDFIYKIGCFFSVTFPDGKAKNKYNPKISPQFMQCLSDAIMFKYGELNGFIAQVSEINVTELETLEPPQVETTADKIRATLEPLRKAFEDTSHIDKIIEGFISFKVENKLPSVNKAIVSIELIEFIKPFRKIQDLKILKREKISMLLCYFIKQNTMNETEYSQNYINRMLSECKLNS